MAQATNPTPHPELPHPELPHPELVEGRRTRGFAAVSGKPLQCLHIAANERFLLCPRPTFQLALGRYPVGDPVEFLREDQLDRAPGLGIAAKGAVVMLGDAPSQARARRPGVVAPIPAFHDVNVSPHRVHPAPSSFDKLRMRRCAGGGNKQHPHPELSRHTRDEVCLNILILSLSKDEDVALSSFDKLRMRFCLLPQPIYSPHPLTSSG